MAEVTKEITIKMSDGEEIIIKEQYDESLTDDELYREVTNSIQEFNFSFQEDSNGSVAINRDHITTIRIRNYQEPSVRIIENY